MTSKRRLCASLALLLAGATAHAGEMTKGTPDWKSVGPLAFGPDGLLFVGDTQGGAIFAVDTGDRALDSASDSIAVAGLNEKIAATLGIEPRELMINDLAVNPASGRAYLSVSRGRGPGAAPVLVRVDRSGKLEVVAVENIPFSKATLTNVPAATGSAAPVAKKGMGGSPRSQAITDLAYVDGRVYVAGLSNEEFSSRLVSIPFPFAAVNGGTSVEIFHGAHGRLETKSPVRTFAAYTIKGEPYLMAAYTVPRNFMRLRRREHMERHRSIVLARAPGTPAARRSSRPLRAHRCWDKLAMTSHDCASSATGSPPG